MGKVTFQNSVSVDGFVAGPNDGPENGLGDGGQALFKWYGSGDVDFALPGTDMTFKVSRASADFLTEEWGKLGAMVAGRRMFDIAHAWGGYPPGGGPCFIVTHNPPQKWVKPDSPFVFVTDGVESAIRQAEKVAGGKTVSLSSASILKQALKAGMVDEIILDVAPVLLGGGVSVFDAFATGAIELKCVAAVQGNDVTHMKYRVVK